MFVVSTAGRNLSIKRQMPRASACQVIEKIKRNGKIVSKLLDKLKIRKAKCPLEWTTRVNSRKISKV